jgi:hypothetical protein
MLLKVVFNMLDNDKLNNIIVFVKLFGVSLKDTKINLCHINTVLVKKFYVIKRDRTNLFNYLHKG